MTIHPITRTRPNSLVGCDMPTNDRRLAEWYFKFYSSGHHRNRKPRMRVKPRIRIVND